MRVAAAIPVLVALLGASSVQGRRIAQSASAESRKSFREQKRQQNLQLQQLLQPARLQVRGGATGARGIGGGGMLTRVRGGRTSDAGKLTMVLVEALVETAVESGLILGFVGGAEHLSNRYLTGTKFAEVARLALWTAAVFLSGAATAGPLRWLEKSQLFSIDVTIGEDW
ncbi:unnamed protein product, partial [Hapterophycus canaliculatus]